jgi:hypothetical protein
MFLTARSYSFIVFIQIRRFRHVFYVCLTGWSLLEICISYYSGVDKNRVSLWFPTHCCRFYIAFKGKKPMKDFAISENICNFAARQ